MTREEKDQEIRNLICELESSVSDIGDWKIVKCCEAMLKAEPMPYDIAELTAARQAARDRINELQKELEEDDQKATLPPQTGQPEAPEEEKTENK